MGKGGESDADSQQNPSVLHNPAFAPFLHDNFNVAEFASTVLAGSHTTAQAQSEQLREGVRVLEGELCSEVTGRSAELLNNVKRMVHAESSLQDVVLSVDSLQSAVRRIRGEVVGPYETVKSKTRQLHNLHGTIDALRLLIHRMKLTQKLKAQLAAAPASLDLAKAAKLITDIRAVEAEGDLSGIQVVAAEEALLQQSTASVRQQAEEALIDGLESLSQAKVGSALQVLFNLGELQQAVSARMSKYLHDLEKAARTALDPRQLGAPASQMQAGPRPGGALAATAAGSWQDKLWQGLREVADQLQSAATAVWHLQRVVAKKRDPLTHVCFLDVLLQADKPLLSQRFWDDAVRVLTDVFATVSKSGKGGVLRDVLTHGYPKLAVLMEAMFDRLASETTMKGVPPAVLPHQLQQLVGCAAPFEAAYRASCLHCLSEAVASAFPGGSRSLPSPADVQKCIGVMHEELRAAGSSPLLAATIASEVSTALQLLAKKAEFMAATGPDVRAVADRTPANPAQIRNIALCSQLQEVHRSLSGLLPRLPPPATAALGEALAAVQAAAIEAVAPMFRAAMEAMEAKLLGMHDLSYEDQQRGDAQDDAQAGSEGGAAGGGMVNTSTYIQECTSLIASFRSEFLAKFVPVPSPNVPSCVSALVERMASRLLVFFVRHASLVRPLGLQGKLQLAKDLAELQLAVGQSLFPLEQLVQPYRLLKAFRVLLFQQEVSGVLSSPLIRDLPASITLHYLFSRLPASLLAPHERSGLSAAQYSLWLDEHSVEDVLEGMAGALEGAQASGEAAGCQEVLRVMQAVCQQGRARAGGK